MDKMDPGGKMVSAGIYYGNKIVLLMTKILFL